MEVKVVSSVRTTSVEETSQEPVTGEATERSDVNLEMVLLDYMEEKQENLKDEEILNEKEGGYLVISESENIYLDTDVGSGDVETAEENNKELSEDGPNSEAMKLRSGSGDKYEDEDPKDGEGMSSDRVIVKKEPVSFVMKKKEVTPKDMEESMDTNNLGSFGPQFMLNIKTPFPPASSSSSSQSSFSSSSSSSSFYSSSSSTSSSSLHKLLCGVVLVCLAIN